MSIHFGKPSEREPEDDQEPDAEHQEPDAEHEEALRRLLDDHGDDNTFNPRTGEDPGLLPLTEDPLERRQKRITM